MAFGKRSAGDAPLPRVPQIDAPPEDSLLSAPGIGAVRTRVTNPGDTIDRKFIALAAAVVVLAASAAILVPSLVSALGGNVRPIEDVIAGLDRPAARNALAREAFPDGDGKAFMTSLATNFPREHGRVLDTLADAAMAGGDRDDLYASLNGWATSFVPRQMAAVGRTGARGFNESIGILDDVMKVAEQEIGCTGAKFQQAVVDPDFMDRLKRFDSPAYHTGMRANRTFIDLAAAGRTMPAFSTTLTANDMSVVQSTFFQMLGDPQVMSIMQAASASQGNNFQAQSQMLNNVNFCQLGRTLLVKMKGLPDGTKSRLFGTLMAANPAAFNGMDGFATSFGRLGASR